MSLKRDNDTDKKEKIIKHLSNLSNEELLYLRNAHREYKDNKYWRIAIKELLKSRGIDSK